jgi:hypothetical protein
MSSTQCDIISNGFIHLFYLENNYLVSRNTLAIGGKNRCLIYK